MANEYKHKFASVVLAAGEGKRMRSTLPKVMHLLAGKPLIAHVLLSLQPLAPEQTVVVVAPGMDSVRAAASQAMKQCSFAVQEKQQGTGHAVMCAAQALAGYAGTVLVLYGDTPL